MSESRTESRTMLARTTGLSESDYHELLVAQRRREMLTILEGRADPIDLETLAATVAAREVGEDVPDDETVERVAIDLHHVHLPKMDGAGVVDYDPDANLIEPRLRSADSWNGPSAFR